MTNLNKVNFMSKTRFDNLASTNDDELYIVETDIALDSDVVHKTGDETIAGNKTISNNLIVSGTTTLNNDVSITGVTNVSNNTRIGGVLSLTSQSSGQHFQFLNIGTTNNVDSYKDITGIGTDNKRIGGVRFNHNENNVHKTILYTGDDTNTYATDLQVCYDNTNSIGYITTNIQPAASNDTSSNIIPTIGWVNDATKSTNVVHKTSDETISGSKSITGNIILKTKNASIPNNSLYGEMAQQGNSYFDLIGLYDTTNNCRCATIRAYNRPDKHGILIGANDFNNGAPTGIDISYDDSDNLIATAPTPAAGNNSTQIATTAFIINVLKAIYPVGSIYIGTQSTCPMASFFGTWTLVAQDKALWGGNGTNGNTTIEAGLPNITGSFSAAKEFRVRSVSGAFTSSDSSKDGLGDEKSDTSDHTITFNASNSNSIYGNSNTVQPPAYVVNVWRRTA